MGRAIQPESYDDEFDAEDNGNSYEKDDDEHDDVASPPGSLTSGWRAGGMQGKAQGSLSCRPELDPAMAEVEPAADYIPLFLHCTQSRVKYVLDCHFLRYIDMK